MIDARVFIKHPLRVQGNTKIYPPSVSDVLGNNAYSQFVKVLTITQDDIRDELIKKEEPKEKIDQAPTPFEFLLINSYHNDTFRIITEKAFEFFLHEKISFLFEEKTILVGDLEKRILEIESLDQIVKINEDNYFDFQNLIRIACGDEPIEPPAPPDTNEDPRIAKMKMKARERDRIKARKGVKGGISITTSLIAICCMGIGITPLNIGEMSYAAIGPIMKMSQDKEKYDIDIRSLLAGADSKKIKPKYWIRNSD